MSDLVQRLQDVIDEHRGNRSPVYAGACNYVPINVLEDLLADSADTESVVRAVLFERFPIAFGPSEVRVPGGGWISHSYWVHETASAITAALSPTDRGDAQEVPC